VIVGCWARAESNLPPCALELGGDKFLGAGTDLFFCLRLILSGGNRRCHQKPRWVPCSKHGSEGNFPIPDGDLDNEIAIALMRTSNEVQIRAFVEEIMGSILTSFLKGYWMLMLLMVNIILHPRDSGNMDESCKLQLPGTSTTCLYKYERTDNVLWENI